MSRKNANPGAKERSAERRKAVIEYRLARMPTRMIGERLGISHTQVLRDLKTVLSELRAATQESAEDLRYLESERLDMAAVAIASKVVKGDLPAIDRWIRISESYRELMGLDAPKKHAPTNPAGDQPYAPPSRDEDLETIAEEFDRIEVLLERARVRRDKSANNKSPQQT